MAHGSLSMRLLIFHIPFKARIYFGKLNIILLKEREGEKEAWTGFAVFHIYI